MPRGNPNIPKSSEHREKIRLGNLDKTLSQETRRKISEKMKGVNLGSQTNLGRSLSVEHKEKLRQASLGRTHSSQTKTRIGRANREHPLRLQKFLLSRSIETKCEVYFGKYRVDTYDKVKHVVYELDGREHDKEYDRQRDEYLKSEFGLEVIRFTEDDLRRV